MWAIRKRYQDENGTWDSVMDSEGVYLSAAECKTHCLDLANEVMKTWHALGGYDAHVRGFPRGYSVRSRRSLMRFDAVEITFSVDGDASGVRYKDKNEAILRAQELANGYFEELRAKFEERNPEKTFVGHVELVKNGFSVLTLYGGKTFLVVGEIKN